MNKSVLIFFALIAVLAQGCKLDPPIFGPPPKEDWSASFQPLGTGTFWKYVTVKEGEEPDSSTLTVTGEQPIINDSLYHTIFSISKKNAGNGFVYVDSNMIKARLFYAEYNDNIDFQYYNMTAPVGGTWTDKITDSGTLEGYPARVVGTMVAVNTTKVVNGITFPRVTHTRMLLQQNKGSGFTTFITFDYYIQMGVGVIETTGIKSDGTDMGRVSIYAYDIKSNDIIKYVK
nr:hypothetical protein [uncultured Mucilaginibacter sp.]